MKLDIRLLFNRCPQGNFLSRAKPNKRFSVRVVREGLLYWTFMINIKINFKMYTRAICWTEHFCLLLFIHCHPNESSIFNLKKKPTNISRNSIGYSKEIMTKIFQYKKHHQKQSHIYLNSHISSLKFLWTTFIHTTSCTHQKCALYKA